MDRPTSTWRWYLVAYPTIALLGSALFWFGRRDHMLLELEGIFVIVAAGVTVGGALLLLAIGGLAVGAAWR